MCNVERRSGGRTALQSATAAALIAFAPIGTPALVWAQTIRDADISRRLAAGDIVIEVTALAEGTGGRVTAIIDIPASQRRLWDVMLDCRRSLRIVESMKSCKVTSADPGGSWDVREHVVQWLWPLPTVRSVFRSEYVPFERIGFRRSDGDLKMLQGAWHLEPLPAGRGTRLHYDATIDPGVPLPGFLVRDAIKADARKTLAALRREAAVDGL